MLILVGLTWMFVVLLMAAAEATSPQGSVLGAFFTFLLYGAVPLSIVLYIMGTPARRRRRHLQEMQEREEMRARQGASSAPPPKDVPSPPPGA